MALSVRVLPSVRDHGLDQRSCHSADVVELDVAQDDDRCFVEQAPAPRHVSLPADEPRDHRGTIY